MASEELQYPQRIPLVLALPPERHYIVSKAVHLGYDLREDLRAYRHAVATDTCAEKARLLQETLPGENWMPNRVIKALYGIVGWDPYVFVLPELRPGQVRKKEPHSGGSRRKRRLLHRLGKTFGMVNEGVVERLLTSVGFKHDDYRPFFAPRLCPVLMGDKVIYTVPEGYEALYDKNESIPSSMESGTCTPFLRWEELYSNKVERGKINDTYGGVQAVFIHDEPSLNDKLVDISVGGRGEEAHRTSLQLPYQAIYDILVAKFGPERIFRMRFW